MFLKRILTPQDVEKMKTDRNLRGLLRAFETGSEETYLAAYQALIHYSPAPLSEMQKLLGQSDSLLQIRAARALGEMGDVRAIPTLLENLALSVDDDLSRALARSLDQLQWQPTPDRFGALYYCTREEWLNCLHCGAAAVPALSRALDDILSRSPEQWGEPEQRGVEEISQVLAASGEASVSSLMELFQSHTPRKRAQAAQVLLKIGKPATAALCALLDAAGDESLLLAAIELLRQLKDPASIDPLVRKLMSSSDANVQKAISDVLGEMGGENGARALSAAQRAVTASVVWESHQPGYDREAKQSARRQLGYIERALGAIGPAAIDVLSDQLVSTDDVLVERTMTTLQRMGSAVYPRMRELLRSPNSILRGRAMDMLLRLGWEPENPDDAAFAAIARGQWQTLESQGQSAVPALTAALRFWDYGLRLRAAQTLEQIGAELSEPEDLVYYYSAKTAFESCVEMGRAAVKPLIKNLQEAVELGSLLPEDALRLRTLQGCTDALVHIGQPAVVDLIVVLESRLGHLRPIAADILARIGEPAVGMLLQTGREHKSDDVRYEAARALYQIEHTPMEFYLEKLRDSSTRIRLLAVTSFHQQSDERAKKALTRLAENRSEDPAVRKAATLALGKTRDPRYIPVLSAIIGGDNRDMQITGIHALTEMGPAANQSDVIRLLIDILTDQEGRLQQDAATALAVIGDEDCASLLMDLLLRLDQQLSAAESDPSVRLQLNRLEQLRVVVIRALSAMEHSAARVLFERILNEQINWRGSFTRVVQGMGEGARNFLLGELASPVRARRFLAAEWLARFQWVPAEGEAAAAYAIAQQQWDEVFKFGEAAIAPLVNMLDSDRESTRKRAAELLDALGWVPQPNATGCNYWIIRGEFTRCTQCGAAAATPLIEALRETVLAAAQPSARGLEVLNERRNQLKLALYQLGPEAVPVLASYFAAPETEENLRVHLSHVMKYIGHPAEETLMTLLTHKGTPMSVRQQSAWALGEIKSAAAAQPLLAIVSEQAAREQVDARGAVVNIQLLRDSIQALEKICAAHRNLPLLRQVRQVMGVFINNYSIESEDVSVDALRLIRLCDVALRESDDRG